MTSPTPPLALTRAQAGIWFDEKLSDQPLAYNMADYLDITGPLDERLLVSALGLLFEEVECVRARFGETDGLPVQRVLPLSTLPLRFVDLRDHRDPAAQAHVFMDEDLRLPFELEGAGPLFRAVLFRISEERSFLYLAMHHLLLDGHGRTAVHRRFSEICTALAAGTPVAPPASAPLAALIDDEAEYLGSRAMRRDAEFWGSHLPAGVEPVSLSTADPVPATELFRRSVALDTASAGTLRAAAAAAGVTWPAFVIAAGAAYVGKVTGLPDVLLTLPMTARITKTARAVPGMVANYLPFPARVGYDVTVGQLLADSSRTLIRSLRHQRYPHGEIRKALGMHSDDRRPFGPFVNVMSQEPVLRLGPCRARLNNVSTGIVDDLMITVLDGADGTLELHMNGNPALYGEAETDAHLHRFAAFLRALAAAAPSTPLGRIGRITPSERQASLAAGTGPEGEVGAGVVERVRAQAAARPGATAVTDGLVTASYSSLVSWSDSLSRDLRADGVGADDLVGVLAPPGAGFVGGVLGVLGAGAAWVPLDVNAPLARTAGLVTDAGVKCLLIHPDCRALAAKLFAHTGELLPSVALDPVALTADTVPLSGLSRPLGGPRDLAYTIFTSGSTGRPKGAMVERLGMVNHLLAKVEDLDLGTGDRVVHNAPVTFDVSVWQMLAPLLVGGSVRVVTHETAADPDALFALIRDEDVTVLEVVPSLLRAALDHWDTAPAAPATAGLRTLVVTGEALPPDLCTRWWRLAPEIPLVNAYGPTECSDDVTHAVLAADGPAPTVRTPIGLPVRNTRLYVLDRDLGLSPDGANGELYVGGTGVGRGYLNDPVKTAVTFLPDPHGPAGSRMYRTGDRVIRRADGQLEFVERQDHQVKIRGHRVELGEIEAVLRTLGHVDDAAVTATAQPTGATILTAYLVIAPERLDGARTALRSLLPHYLMPTHWVALGALPLTPHGKVDRAALPARPAAVRPDVAALQGGDAGSGPDSGADASRTAVLQALFMDVLGLPSVGPHDSFFVLGGDSITAIQLISRARGRDLALTSLDIFRLKTPSALAGLRRIVDGAELPVTDDGVGEIVPTPIIAQLAEDLGSLDARAGRYSQHVLLRVPAGLTADSLAPLIQALIDRHDALRMRIDEPVAGLWNLLTAERGAVAAADLITSVDAGKSLGVPAELDALVAAGAVEARERLAPQDGVMLQAVLFTGVPGQDGRLLLAAHHTVIDGVSWRILGADLQSAWQAAEAGRPIVLDAVTTSYRSWAATLAEESRTADRTAELPYWMAQSAAGQAPLGRRPLDPAEDTYGHAGSLRVTLPPETTAALLTTVPTAFNGEINDVLLSTFALAVADWRSRSGTGADEGDVLLELEGHGREQIVESADLSRTVGWFTTAFPLRLTPGTGRTAPPCATGDELGRAVKRVKEQLRALPDHGIGYGLLRHLNPQTGRLLAARPTPAIGFNYLGRFRVGSAAGAWSPDGGGAVIGTGVHPDMPLRHTLAVTPVTEDSADGPRLAADWLWADGVLTHDEVHDLAATWFRVLTRLVEHTAALGAGGLTPSDVPLVSLGQEEIEGLEAIAAESGSGRLADILPLTALQRGLLFQNEFDGRGPDLYTVQLTADLHGTVDADVLESSLAALMERHPGLGAGFCYRDAGDPVSVLRTGVRVPLVRADLTDLPVARHPERLREIAEADRLRRFDLADPPLMRWALVRLGERHHQLIWTIHHILVDGWSLPVLVRELLSGYVAGGGAATTALLPPVRPFSDYLRGIAERDHEADRALWRSALDGIDGPTHLCPVPPGRAPVPPGTVTLRLSEDETAGLTGFSARNGITANTLLQGGWALLLGSLLNRTDVLFGCVVSTRPPGLPGVESIVGPFLNTVPARVTFSADELPRDFLRRVQDEQTALRDVVHLGLSDMLNGSPALAGSGEPFDTALVFENFPVNTAPQDLTAGHDLVVGDVGARDARHYPLSLVVQPGAEMELRFDHAPDLLSAETVDRIARRFTALLRDMTAEPQRPLGRLLGPGLQVPAGLPQSTVSAGSPHTGGSAGSQETAGQTEQTLRQVFADVLGLPDAAADDNFFLLGGDSISAIRVVSRARAHGLTLTPRDVFGHKTPAALATVARTGPPAAPDQPAAPLLDMSEGEMDELDLELES